MDIIQKLALAFFGVLLTVMFFGTMVYTVMAQNPQVQNSLPTYLGLLLAVPVVVIIIAVAAFRAS